MSTINKMRRALHLTQRTLGDVEAVRRNRVGQRVVNRVMGRFVSNFMRRLWR